MIWKQFPLTTMLEDLSTEDGKLSALRRIADRGLPDDLLFLIVVAADGVEPWIIRAEAFRFLRDVDLD
ncbi:hypothetical protein [Deinococcus sp. QL22]|uniref:hypothetical protein n=1 Tax=Deinococcus sp. QL22 TaxID=2939437 RepID=UPI002018212D|nr:hypothetical protein [Deinococcus sp. QL22]UQN06520.1 hypothetical protein M1R55_00960 [Deinococcus sp. QL22]